MSYEINIEIKRTKYFQSASLSETIRIDKRWDKERIAQVIADKQDWLTQLCEAQLERGIIKRGGEVK